MSEAAIPERASYGPREAMPLDGFLEQVSRVSLDDPSTNVDRNGRVADANRRQAALIWAEIHRRHPQAVEWLLDVTLRRPMTFPGLDRDAKMSIVEGREGENRVVWWILQMIAEGRGEMPPAREGV